MSEIVVPAAGNDTSNKTGQDPGQQLSGLPPSAGITLKPEERQPIMPATQRDPASPADYRRHLHPKKLVKAAIRVSVIRTLYLSMRFGSRVIIMRGTRLRLARGAKISVARGSRLILGPNTTHAVGPPCSLRLRSNAPLTVHGNAEIFRGTSVLVSDNAHLEMGHKSYINFDSTVICFDHITIGSDCAISWNTNMLDGNAHELVVDEAR